MREGEEGRRTALTERNNERRGSVKLCSRVEFQVWVVHAGVNPCLVGLGIGIGHRI